MSTQLTLWDKLLPDQQRNNQYFRGDMKHYYASLYDLILRTSDIHAPGEIFKLTTSDRVGIVEMASNPVQLRLLEMIIRISGARRVLEIGAFIGLSAMTMARALPPDGELITIEKFSHFAEICRQNFVANELDDRITLLEGDAFEVLETLPRNRLFDVAFIDGNKERYAHYFQALEPRVRSGGLIIVDDVFFHGDVLNSPPTTEKGAGVSAFLDLAAQRPDFLRLALPFSNGLM